MPPNSLAPKKPLMTRSTDSHAIQIEIDGRMVAAAEVSRTDDPDVVRSALHAESGHLPAGSRTKLVDAVLEDPQVSAASHLAASVPTGDTEMLDRIRERAQSVDIRSAGATALVDADLRRDQDDPGDRPGRSAEAAAHPPLPRTPSASERRADAGGAATRAAESKPSADCDNR
jgi:hypothetical protein